jgi:alkylated DNA repair dioxygenase AlkB
VDLFGSEMPEIIRAEGADLTFYRDVDFGMSDLRILAELISTTEWRQESIVVWGKKHVQPRLVAWFGDEGKSYSYSGIKLEPKPWNELLLRLRSKTQSISKVEFNSVLLNYYRDGNDSMGFHSDDERELGDTPAIASLSFGAERIFTMKSKSGQLPDIKIRLSSSSLLIMKGDTQKNWKHGIQKSSSPLGPRVNLTFRKILSSRNSEPVTI